MLLIIWCLLSYLLFLFFFFSYYFIQHLNLVTSSISSFPLLFYIKKIKHMIFYLNSINKIILIKWSNAREIHILTPNMLK